MSFDIIKKEKIKITPFAGLSQSSGDCKREKDSPTALSVLELLLKQDTDMFTAAQTIRDFMILEQINAAEAAEALSMTEQAVKDKLLLLELSGCERKLILSLGYTEGTAVCLAAMSRAEREKTLLYCRKNGFTAAQAKQYTEGAKGEEKADVQPEKSRGKILSVVKDMGFIINSVEHAVDVARSSGFAVENSRDELDDGVQLTIRLKNRNKH